MPRRLLETAAMGSDSGGPIAGARMAVYGALQPVADDAA